MNAVATRGSTKEVATKEWNTRVTRIILMIASLLITWFVFATADNHITNPVILAVAIALGCFCFDGIAQEVPFHNKNTFYVAGYAACVSLMTSVGLMLYYQPWRSAK